MNFDKYKADGLGLEPRMEFVKKIQPLFIQLNQNFLAIKEKVQSGDLENLQPLIDGWIDSDASKNVRAAILEMFNNQLDNLRTDVKFNMYSNLLGGIKWIEQVIQRQVNFAQRHMPLELKEYIKYGRLPLYPIRDSDEKNDLNKKYLQSFANDYLDLVGDFEDAFYEVYPTYQPLLPSGVQSSDLTTYTPRIILDYHGREENAVINLHDALNVRFIKEINLEDFSLHFSVDGFLPKLIWIEDDNLLYQLFLGLTYKSSSSRERTKYLQIKNDPYSCIRNHFRSLTKEFPDNNNIKRNFNKSSTHHSISDGIKKLVKFFEEFNS